MKTQTLNGLKSWLAEDSNFQSDTNNAAVSKPPRPPSTADWLCRFANLILCADTGVCSKAGKNKGPRQALKWAFVIYCLLDLKRIVHWRGEFQQNSELLVNRDVQRARNRLVSEWKPAFLQPCLKLHKTPRIAVNASDVLNDSNIYLKLIFTVETLSIFLDQLTREKIKTWSKLVLSHY